MKLRYFFFSLFWQVIDGVLAFGSVWAEIFHLNCRDADDAGIIFASRKEMFVRDIKKEGRGGVLPDFMRASGMWDAKVRIKLSRIFWLQQQRQVFVLNLISEDIS